MSPVTLPLNASVAVIAFFRSAFPLFRLQSGGTSGATASATNGGRGHGLNTGGCSGHGRG